jgi:pimeloyl-ACP methyl ester carboxylesterase
VSTLVLAEAPVVPLFVGDPPKPLELLRVLVTRPRTAAAIMKFGATGIGPATAAAKRDDMDTAMRVNGTAILGREFYRQLSASRLEQVHANSIKAEFLGSGFPPLAAHQVRSVQTPTLLVTGQSSPAIFHRLTDRLAELLPRNERILVDAASHIMHEDNAAAFNEAVLSFLTKHSPAA